MHVYVHTHASTKTQDVLLHVKLWKELKHSQMAAYNKASQNSGCRQSTKVTFSENKKSKSGPAEAGEKKQHTPNSLHSPMPGKIQ